MAARIPDLWRAKEDARRLYALYLCRLQMNCLHEQVVTACRKIRRHAARGPGPKEGLFTFDFEIDALCHLKNYKIAWRQLRLREEIVFGQRFDLARRRWSAADSHELRFSYAPLLYFLGRHGLGCSLLETSLSYRFHGKVRSYDILFDVHNGDEEPSDRCRVTLKHFYDRLGKDLREWQHWEAFVDGFNSRLFRLAAVRREDVREDATRLSVFFDNLLAIRAERTTSGVTRGQADLIESPAKVRKWQKATQEKREQFNERIRPTRELFDTKLRKFFPELEGLPK